MAIYTIKYGDTLSQIARANGTTVAALASANGIADPNKIRAGAVLNIPSSSENTSNKVWTQAEVDAATAANTDALKNNAITSAHINAGNSAEQLAYASSTGDYSGLVDTYGQPFSLEDQQKALTQATADNQDYYDAQKQKDTQDAESSLKQKQLDYQNYLATSKTKFESDKSTLDQNAANQGVLFSGGRAQKEQSLKKSYEQDQAYKQASVGGSIGDVARDYQYKYGNNNADNLSNYYNLGGNQYNTGVANGGVTSSGLSSIYSTGSSNFQGTNINTAKAEAQKRAAGYLWNKGNKLVTGGYNNQY